MRNKNTAISSHLERSPIRSANIKIYRFLLIFIFLSLAGVGTVFAQSNTDLIYGVVNFGYTPVDGIQVSLIEAQTGDFAASMVSGNLPPDGGTGVPRTGEFEFMGTAGTEYILHFEDPSGNYTSSFYPSGSEVGLAQPVVASTYLVEVGLQSAVGLIYGNIRTEFDYTPLGGIQITLIDPLTGEPALTGTSGEGTGEFAITAPLGKTYLAKFSDPSGVYKTQFYPDSPNAKGAQPISADYSDFEVVLVPVLGRILGVVSDSSTYTPINGIQVAIIDAVTGEISAFATTVTGGLEGTGEITDGLFDMYVQRDRDYIVHFHDATGTYISAFYPYANTTNSAEIINMASSGWKSLDVDMTPSGSVPPSNIGTISGEVDGFENQNYSPLEAIQVNFIDAVTGFNTATTFTDASGSFSQPLPAPGDYLLQFSDPSGKFYPELYLGSQSLTETPPVTAPEGSTASGVSAVLTTIEGAWGTGKIAAKAVYPVLTEDTTTGEFYYAHVGLPSITVTIINQATLKPVATGTTGAGGNFTATVPAPGGYLVHFFDPNGEYATDFSFSTSYHAATVYAQHGLTVSDGAKGVMYLYNYDNPPPDPPTGTGYYNGRVFYGAGQKLSNIKVTFMNAETLEIVKTDTSDYWGLVETILPAPAEYVVLFTDPLGKFYCELRGAPYPCTFSESGLSQSVGTNFAFVEPASEPNLFNEQISLIQLPPEEYPGMGYIQGTVFQADGTTPLAGIEVTFINAATGNSAAVIKTDIAGTYSQQLLAPGDYIVRFSDPNGVYGLQFHPAVTKIPDTIPVNVIDTIYTDQINASLSLYTEPNPITIGTIAGTVHGTSLDGLEVPVVAGMKIEFINAADGKTVVSTTTDSAGKYSQALPLPGEYVVRFTDPNLLGPYQSVYYNDVQALKLAYPVLLEADYPSQMFIDFYPFLAHYQVIGTVTGEVWSAGGGTNELAPVSGIDVTFFDTGSGKRITTAKTDASGNYFQLLQNPAEYFVLFSDPLELGPYFSQFYDNSQQFDTATPLLLNWQPYSVPNPNALLKSKQVKIEGGVGVNDGGAGTGVASSVIGVKVSIFNVADGKLVASKTIITEDGYYSQLLPRPGAYILKYSDPDKVGPYLSKFYNGDTFVNSEPVIMTADMIAKNLSMVYLDFDNRPPVADAGADQTMEAITSDGASVTLSAGDPSDPDGDPITFSWNWEIGAESKTASGPISIVIFPLGTHLVTLTVTDSGGLFDIDTVQIIVQDTIAPEITQAPSDLTVDATGALTQVALGTLVATDAANPDPVVTNNAPVDDFFPVGTTVVTWTATDASGNWASHDQTVTVTEPGLTFGGFQSPVENPPALNTAKAGSTVPVKWQIFDTLGGYVRDLGVVVSSHFASTSCTEAFTSYENPVETETTGNSGLRYDSATEQYVFNWKTDKASAGGCYVFILELEGGGKNLANFKLK